MSITPFYDPSFSKGPLPANRWAYWSTATTYVVSFSDGTAGHLAKALLERSVLYYMPFQEFTANEANSADGVSQYGNITISTGTFVPPQEEFNTIEIIDPELCSFIAVHYYDPVAIKAKFPGAKNLVITHTEADIEEITINWVYKASPPGSEAGISFDYFTPYAPSVFKDLEGVGFNLMTPSQKRRVVKWAMGSTITRGFHLLGLDQQTDPDLVVLAYQDLMNNPSRVAQAIEQLTGRGLTPDAERALLYYQTRQREFMTRVRAELGL